MNRSNFRLNRRRLMSRFGAAGIGVAATSGIFPALADTIADAKKSYSGPVKQIAAKKGPFRIGFANGFSGNSWRASASPRSRSRPKARGRREPIILDGQNDITKQVNDIENLIGQQVDAILVIAELGLGGVAGAPERRTRRASSSRPSTCRSREGYDAYVGTDPTTRECRPAPGCSKALGGKGKIVGSGHRRQLLYRRRLEGCPEGDRGQPDRGAGLSGTRTGPRTRPR